MYPVSMLGSNVNSGSLPNNSERGDNKHLVQLYRPILLDNKTYGRTSEKM